jgi:hypothetical protein
MKSSIPYIVLSTVLLAPYTAKADTLSFTYEELVVLTDDVMPLLDLIASGEGNYNSVNRGRAGDSPGDWAQTNLGKSITEMSIKEVRQHQGGRTSDCWYNGTKGKANLFAVGRYQLIPCTLQYATASIDDLDVRMLYEPEVQDAFGVFLLFVKRPVLGEYLLGEHDNLQEAGQELAKEFASVPIQYSNGRCNRGQSYYCGDKAGNKSHIAIEDVNKALKQVRNNLDGHTDIQHLIKNKREKKQDKKQRLRSRIGGWWNTFRGKSVIPEPTMPLVNTMDQTLFDYIYPDESNEVNSTLETPLELQQVPATNLGPSQILKNQATEANEVKTIKEDNENTAQPTLKEEPVNLNPENNVETDIPVPVTKEPNPSKPIEVLTPEYDDEVVDPRITPQNNKTP